MNSKGKCTCLDPEEVIGTCEALGDGAMLGTKVVGVLTSLLMLSDIAWGVLLVIMIIVWMVCFLVGVAYGPKVHYKEPCTVQRCRRRQKWSKTEIRDGIIALEAALQS